MEQGLYSRSQVERLLHAWRELAQGRYPADNTAPPGYRGRQQAEKAPFTLAIEALADLEAAIKRLPRRIRKAVYHRFWERRETNRRKAELVTLVHCSINGHPLPSLQ